MHFSRSHYITLITVFFSVLLITLWARPQYRKSELKPPPPSQPVSPSKTPADTVEMHSRVQPTIPVSADDYMGNKEYAADLRDPSIVTPYMMSVEVYNKMAVHRDLSIISMSEIEKASRRRIKSLSISSI